MGRTCSCGTQLEMMCLAQQPSMPLSSLAPMWILVLENLDHVVLNLEMAQDTMSYCASMLDALEDIVEKDNLYPWPLVHTTAGAA